VVAATEPFELAGAVGSGEECLAVLPGLRPDLSAARRRVAGMDGVEAATRIAA
jgi:CheY-like chemotaxis protein